MGDRCAACGFERKEHTYNGACYGICGEFVDRSVGDTLTGYTREGLRGQAMKHLSECEAGNFMGCSYAEIRAARGADTRRRDFMRRLMSNIDGKKDEEIARLRSVITHIIETWHCGDITPEDIAICRSALAISSQLLGTEK